jgi:hypothetical protein
MEGARVKRLESKHPAAIRWFHWINFPLLAIMIWSGLLIYWANDVYRIGLGRFTLFQFFPDAFYNIFHIDHRRLQCGQPFQMGIARLPYHTHAALAQLFGDLILRQNLTDHGDLR